MEGSSTEDEPSSSLQYSSDSYNLQKIFPEEIWLEILTKAHWSTREAAYHSSSYLRHLLYPTRQVFLFPHVYKLIGAKFEYGTEPAYYTERHPKKLWVRNILNLRLVCKDWCAGIENFYETCYPLYSFDHSVLQARIDFGLDSNEERKRRISYMEGLGNWVYYEFSVGSRATTNISHFLRRFALSHGPNLNPFIGRCVVFNGNGAARGCGDLTQAQAQSFLSEILELLEKYGKHIWFCTFNLFGDIYRSTNLLSRIREYLMLMPNLKVLRLGLPLNEGEEPTAVKIQMEGQGIPTLPHLELLSLSCTPEFFINELLSANAHISRLEMRIGCHIDLNGVQLPNLRHLAIYVASAQKFEMLETCTQTWPLLTLHVEISLSIPFFPRERIFWFLEKWRDSLTDVMVDMPTAQTNEQRITVYTDNQIRLNLPKLKRFGVHFPNTSGIDFMLPMKSLELFVVSIGYDDWANDAISEELWAQVDKERVIDFSVYADENLYECDIWSFFPNLKRIYSTGDRQFALSEAFLRGVWETLTSSRLSEQLRNDSS